MSAPARASELAPALAEPVPSTTSIASVARSGPARVLIPGTWRTFENREVLRGMGLRWDPPTHAWHGQLTPHERTVLRERFGIAIRPVVALEAFPVEEATSPVPVMEPPCRPKPPRGPSPSFSTPSNLPPRAHDGSRTRAEARILLKPGVPDPDDQESGFAGDDGRVYSWWDVTSGLPDDSREEDERRAERRLRDLRGRVKAARALVSATQDLASTLANNPWNAAAFYARFGVTAGQLRDGIPPSARV